MKPISMEMPDRLVADVDTLRHDYGRFFAEPLERGYGTTLGNALRRVLLASLPGAAVTAVEIEGVPHEYTTVDGVVEDVRRLAVAQHGRVPHRVAGSPSSGDAVRALIQQIRPAPKLNRKRGAGRDEY